MNSKKQHSSFLILSFYSCSNDNYSFIKGTTMGTTYSIKYSNSSSLSLSQIQTEIDNILDLINKQMSTYISDSEISLNKTSKDVKHAVSSDFYYVVDKRKIL